MPGRNVAEAISAFIMPIQQAASVLGSCKVTCSSKAYAARPDEGDEYSWSLCSGDGVSVKAGPLAPPGDLRFYASMSWRVITDDRDGYGPLRVTATRYDYSLMVADQELWALHWHPQGRSPITYPHIHLGTPLLAEGAHITPKDHPPTGRMTFESAVRWVVESCGVPAHDDWEDRLTLAETPHLLYRTWSHHIDASGAG